MIGMIVLAVAALATPDPVELRYRPLGQPARSAEATVTQVAAETVIEWLDGMGKKIGESRVAFQNGRAKAVPPARAVTLRAVGPDVFSRTAGLSPAPVDLQLLPVGTLRVTGLGPVPGTQTAFAVEAAAPGRGMPQSPVLQIRASERSKDPEKSWTSFPLPAGTLAVAIDEGPSRPPRLLEKVEVTPGSVMEISPMPVEGREVVILLRARSTGKPLRGARVDVPEAGTAPDRALATLLERRTSPSGDDGRLVVGKLPAEGPWAIRVAAVGQRTGVVKLGKGFEEGTREIFLSPFQSVEIRVRGLVLKRDDPRPEVSLAYCQVQTPRSSCHPAEPRKMPLGAEGVAVFHGAAPGRYQAGLLFPGGSSTRVDIELGGDPDAPDVETVEIQAGRWTVRGKARLRDGTPVEATVGATELVNGLGEGRCAETNSGPDGTFELQVFSSAGRKLHVDARSENPKASSQAPAEVPLTAETTTIEGVVVGLDTTGFELTVRERENGQPVTGCAVLIAFGGAQGGRAGTTNTDAEGKVAMFGLADGDVHVQPQCRGFAPAEETRFTLSPGELRSLDLLVDRAGEISFLVVDPADRPVAGAQVLGLPGQIFWYETWGYSAQAQEIGLTDETGSLTVSGNLWAAKPYFVVSAGSALAMGRFPSPASCPPEQACRKVVHMQPRALFAGAAVRKRSGKPVLTYEVHFSRDGVPIPPDVIALAARANPDASLSIQGRDPFDERLPSLFEPGSYLVRTFKRGPDPKTRPPLLPIGTVVVPLQERVELLDVNSE